MRTYKININSNKRAILFAVIIYPFTFFLMTLIPINWNDVLSFLIIAIFFIGPMYPITLLSRGKIRIELNDSSFKTIWLKRFIFSKEPDVEITWEKLIDYVNQADRGLDSFRLTLVNNKQFKFYRYTYFPQKDDFSRFLTQFPKFIKKVNTAKSTEIEKGLTDFQTRSFKWLLIGLTIVSLGLLFNKLINPNSGIAWPALGVILTGILFYWTQVRTNSN